MRWTSWAIVAVTATWVPGAAPAWADGSEPAFLGGDSTTVTSGGAATVVHVVTAGPLIVTGVDLADVRVTCDPQLSSIPELVCGRDKGGVVTITMTADADVEASGFVVARDRTTGASASLAVEVAPADDSSTQPTSLTLTIAGCESWYDSWFAGCPDHPSGYLDGVEVDLGGGIEVTSGSGIVASEHASAGTIELKDPVAPSTQMTAIVSGLDRFETYEGQVGSGDSAVTVTVKRRAPLLLAFITVLVGAALAALVGWLIDRAVQSSQRRDARQTYDKSLAAWRVDSANALSLVPAGPRRAAWFLEPVQPIELQGVDRSDPAKVDQYSVDLDAARQYWKTLATMLQAEQLLTAAEPGSNVLHWVSNAIDAGPYGSEYGRAELDLLAHAIVQVLQLDRNSDIRKALRAADSTPNVRTAVGISDVVLKSMANGDAAIRMAAVEQERSHQSPVPKSAVVLKWLDANLWKMVVGIFVFMALVTVVLSLARGSLDDFNRRDATVIALYGVALAVVAVVLVRAVTAKGAQLVLVSMLGILLAAAFQEGNALDPNAAWGNTLDILKAFSGSFAIGGATQIVRFGFARSQTDD